MRAMTIFDWILRVAGTIVLVLGLLIWTLQLNIVSIHITFGIIVTLTLLVISILATFARGLRVLGIIGMIYAFVIPLLGLNQVRLLVGDQHWLIQVLHLLVGIGALALGETISRRYLRLKQAQPAVV